MSLKHFHWMFITVGLVLTVGCGEPPDGDSQAAPSAAANETPARPLETPSTVSAPARLSTADEPILCGAPGTDNDLSSLTAEEVSAELGGVEGEGLSLVASDASGHRVNVGCMSTDTAAASLELGLSFGSVLAVDDKVLLILAVPSDRTLRQVDWLRPTSPVRSGNGFNTAVYEFDVSEFGGELTPTEQQLQRLAAEARQGTVSTGGFGPDILA